MARLHGRRGQAVGLSVGRLVGGENERGKGGQARRVWEGVGQAHGGGVAGQAWGQDGAAETAAEAAPTRCRSRHPGWRLALRATRHGQDARATALGVVGFACRKGVMAWMMGAVVGVAALPGWGAVKITPVAMTGQQAAGMEAGVTYSDFFNWFSESPKINAAGQVVFEATVKGPGVGPDNDTGIWSGRAKSLGLVVREGTAVAGLGGEYQFPDLESLRFSEINFNAKGQLAVPVWRDPASPFLTDIWAGSAGSLKPVAALGVEAPGAGGQFQRIGTPVLSPAGTIAFSSSLSSGGGGIWSGRIGSSLSPVLLSGSTLPGLGAGDRFSSVGGPILGTDGELAAFSAGLELASRPGQVVNGVWKRHGESFEMVAKQGDKIAGTQQPYGPIRAIRMSSMGEMALLSGVGESYANWPVGRTTIVYRSDAATMIVARDDDQAPGLAEGVRFGQLGTMAGVFSKLFFVFGGSGQFAINAPLVGEGVNTANDRAIFVGPPDRLRVLVREGDRVPGTSAGTVFAGPAAPQWLSDDVFFSISMNAANQVAFIGRFGDSGGAKGLFATTPEGELVLVAHMGELFDVGGGKLRTITDIYMEPYNDNVPGKATSFNDWGHLVYGLRFNDGSSGIFVAQVPEPGWVGLGLAGVVGLMRRRRR